MIADRGRNQTDLVGFPAPLGSLGEDVARGHHARRPVVITSPAETTALRASTRDLDQEPIAHLGLRRPDSCRRRENFIALQLRYDLSLSTTNGPAQTTFLGTLSRNCATDPRRNAFFGGCVGFNCAVILVTDVIERGHIETATLSRQCQQSLFLGFVFQQRINQFWPKNLAF